MTDEERLVWQAENGYLISKETKDGRWAAIAPLMFTHRIVIGPPNAPWIDDAWCYHSAATAMEAFLAWDADTEPEPRGWHRNPRTGRRRPLGDPALEYVDP